MSKFLLSCSCGQQLAVGPGQAGETLRCECGRPLPVPELRQLRQLPVASEAPAESAAAWGGRHRAITVLALAAIVSLAAASVSWWNQPSLPEFNPAGWTRMMDSRISEFTPAEAWQAWVIMYRPLAVTGFTELKHHNAEAIEREIDARRRMQMVLAAVAAICLVAAATTAFAGRKSAET